MTLNANHLYVCCLCVLISGMAWFFQDECAAGQRSDIPLKARVVLAKAGELIQQKAYDAAIDRLKEFQAQGGPSPDGKDADPDGYYHPEVCFALGTCYLYQADYQQAIPAFEMAVKSNPDHASAWLNLAKSYYESENYFRAAQCFEKTYDRSEEKKPDYLYYCAVAYLMAKQNEPCISVFRQLMSDHPEAIQPAWQENYIYALIAAGRVRQALPYIRKLAEEYRGEKQIQWQEVLLHQYMALDDMHAQALKFARFLTRHAPVQAKWWKALSHIHLQDGAYEKALAALTICNYIDPLSGSEKKLFADLHLQVGIPIKAAPIYKAALLEKNDSGLMMNLMRALQMSGRPEQAIEVLQQFAPESRDTGLLMLKADILYGLERYKESEQAYLQITRIETDQPGKTGRAWLMAGYAALQINDVNAGRRALKRAAEYKRHRKAALQAIQQLSKS